MQQPPEIPMPTIPFDPNAINWADIIGTAGGVVAFVVVAILVFTWMRQRHELAKRKLEIEASRTSPQIQVKEDQNEVRRLKERLENLELLICRLDTEMNQQWERSMLGTSGAFSGEPGAVSQMPTAFVNMISALEGRYQVLKELGRGGMGIVFQAHDKQLNEQVALKIISPMLSTDPESLERLKREVTSARRIAHPNIIRIFDIGESNGLHFVSMEFFPGQNLKEFIRNHGALSLIQGSNIVFQICEGLEAAHRQRIIHRDLKSQNILIGPTGNLKIIDFGLARPIYMEGMTATGLILGTPEYMSPEQVSGKKVDERTDIYSLGIILYEIFTGKLPFRGESAISVGFQQIRDEPHRPRDINPQIPDELERIILKALQKDPNMRYIAISELRKEFEKIAQTSAPEKVKDTAPRETKVPTLNN
ncbi:protein kinase [bacterium]|nr:protein kinase [bacterium]MCI0606591.1 protein kinase [bacterium]